MIFVALGPFSILESITNAAPTVGRQRLCILGDKEYHGI